MEQRVIGPTLKYCPDLKQTFECCRVADRRCEHLRMTDRLIPYCAALQPDPKDNPRPDLGKILRGWPDADPCCPYRGNHQAQTTSYRKRPD